MHVFVTLPTEALLAAAWADIEAFGSLEEAIEYVKENIHLEPGEEIFFAYEAVIDAYNGTYCSVGEEEWEENILSREEMVELVESLKPGEFFLFFALAGKKGEFPLKLYPGFAIKAFCITN